MRGPYTATVKIDRAEPIALAREEVIEGQAIAGRFWDSTTRFGGQLLDVERGAVMATGSMLLPGERAEIEIHGSVAGEPTVVRYHTVERPDDGRGIISGIGCRFNERLFVGV